MAMTLRLGPEREEALRRSAEHQNQSMQQVINTALDEYLVRHDDDARTLELAREEAARFDNLLRRLADT